MATPHSGSSLGPTPPSWPARRRRHRVVANRCGLRRSARPSAPRPPTPRPRLLPVRRLPAPALGPGDRPGPPAVGVGRPRPRPDPRRKATVVRAYEGSGTRTNVPVPPCSSMTPNGDETNRPAGRDAEVGRRDSTPRSGGAGPTVGVSPPPSAEQARQDRRRRSVCGAALKAVRSRRPGARVRRRGPGGAGPAACAFPGNSRRHGAGRRVPGGALLRPVGARRARGPFRRRARGVEDGPPPAGRCPPQPPSSDR